MLSKNTIRSFISLLSFLLMASHATANDEIDLDWSADLSGYTATNNYWPLCGDFSSAQGSTWEEGDPCTSTAEDPIVSTYGPRNQTSVGYDFHRGIDLRTEAMEDDNTSTCGLSCVDNKLPVFAVADGTIYRIEYKCKSGDADGFRITLRHGTSSARWYSRYVHLSSVSPLATVTTPTCSGSSNHNLTGTYSGTSVTGGAHMGYTGKSVSNNHHLHFEIRKDENWARSAVHPVRQLPAISSPGSLDVDALDLQYGPPKIEVDSYRLDVVRVELQAAGCDGVLTSSGLTCDPFALVDPVTRTDGYYEDPPFYDYELFNYQYSHRGGSVWSNTNGFELCPFESDHGSSYDSDLHVTDSTFNSVDVSVTSGVDPYFRSFQLDATALPFFGAFDYTCVRAVATTASGSTLESSRGCRDSAAGAITYVE